MAIAVVSVKRTTVATNSTTVASGAQSHSAGNGLVALIQFQQNAGATTISSVVNTAGDTWTQIGANSPFANAGGVNTQAIYYVSSTTGNGSDNTTVTFSRNSAFNTIAVYEISGHDTSSFYMASGTGSAGSGTAITTGSITVTSNAIILAVFETDAGFTPTSASYTNITADESGGFIWDGRHTVTTSEAAAFTGQSSAPWGILAAAFKEAGGGSVDQPYERRSQQTPNEGLGGMLSNRGGGRIFGRVGDLWLPKAA